MTLCASMSARPCGSAGWFLRGDATGRGSRPTRERGGAGSLVAATLPCDERPRLSFSGHSRSTPASRTPLQMSTPVEPKPAASVVLVRAAGPGAAEPLEVYMIRRNKGMKFLGGFYAFPGGTVDPAAGAPGAPARGRGLGVPEAEAIFPGHAGAPALAFWVTAVRELLEESGVLLACDAAGRPLEARDPEVGAGIERCRRALMAGEVSFGELVAREGWYCDLSGLRYFSHFITPRSSPIRFTARFFLCRMPCGQEPRLD